MGKTRIWLASAAVLAVGISLGVYFLGFHNRQPFPVGTISSAGEADGDTFFFQRTRGARLPNAANSIKVRLLGIDAPDKCKEDEDPCFLCASRDAAAANLGTRRGHEEYRLILYGQDSSPDKRWLGVLYPNREKAMSLNERMVREGFARVYKVKIERNTMKEREFERRLQDVALLEQQLLTAQVSAALDRAGMWADPRYRDGVHIAAIRYWGNDEIVVLANFGDTAVDLSALVIRDDAPERPSTVPAGARVLEPGETEAIECGFRTWPDDGAHKAFLVDRAEAASPDALLGADYCYRGL